MGFAELAALMPVWAVFATALVFVLGCCMGSFMNCMAWRIVHDEDWTRGRSHCAVCNHELGALDLIPVASWFALKGRCRYCKEPISVRYTVAELILGVYFASVFVAFGISIQTLALMALGCLLLGLSLVDLDSMIIPNGYVVAAIIVWVVMVAAQYALGGLASGNSGALGTMWLDAFGGSALAATVADGLAGAFGVSLLVLVVGIAFSKAAGKSGVGMGDIKLFFAVGLYLGLGCAVLNMFLSCVIGLVFALVAGKKKQFPFGPSIAIGTWVTLLAGPLLLTAYLSLF